MKYNVIAMIMIVAITIAMIVVIVVGANSDNNCQRWQNVIIGGQQYPVCVKTSPDSIRK